jgi:hypothetical protein
MTLTIIEVSEDLTIIEPDVEVEEIDLDDFIVIEAP